MKIGTDKPLRVVIYVRVSTEGQAEEEAPLAAQIWECREYALTRGWIVVYVIEDGGISGRTDDRPGFQRMIASAKEKPRPFDGILVWKANRFSRKLEHRITYQALLRRLGIKVISVKEPEFDGALGFLVESILAVVDEFMALQIGEDVLRGQKEIARQGFSAGGRPPKGYRGIKKVVGLRQNGEPIFRTAWEPDPEWKDQALLAFQMAAGGKSFADIVQATGVVANKSSLSTYLHNRAFIGERVYNKQRHLETKAIRITNPEEEWVVVPEAHEAILPQELFERVQQVLSSKRPRTGTTRALSSSYLLTPILWCRRHQCRYVAYPNRERLYYICSERNKKGNSHSPCSLLKKESIETFILQELREEIFTPERVRPMLEDLAANVHTQQEEDQKEAKSIRAKLKKLDAELSNIYKAITEGIPSSQLKKPLEDKLDQQRVLNSRLEQLPGKALKPNQFEATEKAVSNYVNWAWRLLQDGDVIDQKTFLRECIDRMELDGEQVTIYYTFTPIGEEKQEVGFSWLPG